jgi:hypothetical protein
VLEKSETAQREQCNGANPNHQRRERAEIVIEPKTALPVHDAPLAIAPVLRRNSIAGDGSRPICRAGRQIGSNASRGRSVAFPVGGFMTELPIPDGMDGTENNRFWHIPWFAAVQ